MGIKTRLVVFASGLVSGYGAYLLFNYAWMIFTSVLASISLLHIILALMAVAGGLFLGFFFLAFCYLALTR